MERRVSDRPLLRREIDQSARVVMRTRRRIRQQHDDASLFQSSIILSSPLPSFLFRQDKGNQHPKPSVQQQAVLSTKFLEIDSGCRTMPDDIGFGFGDGLGKCPKEWPAYRFLPVTRSSGHSRWPFGRFSSGCPPCSPHVPKPRGKIA